MHKHIIFLLLFTFIISCTNPEPFRSTQADVAVEVHSTVGDAYTGPILTLDTIEIIDDTSPDTNKKFNNENRPDITDTKTKTLPDIKDQ
mgnify:FL=1